MENKNKELLHDETRQKLAEPFPEEDIEWRIQQSGIKDGKPWAMVLAYVTNRAIMERLDDVFGVFGWHNEFKEAPDTGVLCGISVKCPEFDVGWVTKWDGAENTKFEPVKGGLSNAMKRAAVQLNIGRYLYKLKTNWAIFEENGKYKDKIDGTYYNWNPPKLPKWALPNSKTGKKEYPDYIKKPKEKTLFKDTKQTGVKEEKPSEEELKRKPNEEELRHFKDHCLAFFKDEEALNDWLEMTTEKRDEDGTLKIKGKQNVNEIKTLKQLRWLYVMFKKYSEHLDSPEEE